MNVREHHNRTNVPESNNSYIIQKNWTIGNFKHFTSENSPSKLREGVNRIKCKIAWNLTRRVSKGNFIHFLKLLYSRFDLPLPLKNIFWCKERKERKQKIVWKTNQTGLESSRRNFKPIGSLGSQTNSRVC